MPATPVDAATVIVVRHGRPAGTAWKCFMVRRHSLSDFAADVFVFPGGKVDAADRDPEFAEHLEGHPAPTAVPEADLALWRALRVAAIRELFEEAGVLLAHRPDQDILSLTAADKGRFLDYRRGLQHGSLTMLELARTERLILAGDRLHPFSRWITPETFPRRYDTRFFVAIMPARQKPIHDQRETVDSLWIAPQDALTRYRDGRFPLVFATEKHLEKMVEYQSIEEMIAATAAADLTPIVPRVVTRHGERAFLLPGDPGY